MPLLLSVPDFISQSANQNILEEIRQPWIIPLEDPTGRSFGSRRGVNLRPGLDVLIDDYTLQEDLVVEIGTDDADDPDELASLEMSFMLSGHNRNEGVQAHHSFFDAGWEEEDTGEELALWQAGDRVFKFDVHIEKTLFQTLVGEQVQTCPQPLQQILQSSQPISEQFWQIYTVTASMRSAIHQLLHCPYEGLTRWLYWESRIIELIALGLEQVGQPRSCSMSGLLVEDLDSIYYASDIMRQRYIDPPSLFELARLVGLNDRKLKEGFRQVFGTTVFGYLSQHRMEKACQLLQQQQSVAAVAAAVGYASPTAFSGSFRRQLGVSPKRYQLGKRR